MGSEFRWSRGTCSDPYSGADEAANPNDEYPDHFRDWPDRSERETAGVRLIGCIDVGDDVPLLIGSHRRVVEPGHRLRARLHRFVDMCGARVPHRRGFLAVGEGATGTDGVVAHRAVRAEEEETVDRVTQFRIYHLTGWDRRPGAELSDVGGQVEGLRLGELLRLRLRLRPVGRHRHPPGRYLEVHGGSADTDEGGGHLGPLRVEPVAGRAVRNE